MTTHPQLRPELALRPGYHSPQVDAAVRLNTNESPFPPPARYLERLAAAIGGTELNRYPDRAARELRQKIGALHGVSADEVLVGNGSNEVLQALLLAFGGPGRTVLVAEPTYAMHSHIAQNLGSRVIDVARRADFSLDLERVIDAARTEEVSVLFCCSPNNPTGTLESPSTIVRLLEETSAMVVVDEAYGQFAPSSALELDAKWRDRLVVVRTFSKTWALAGVRLGYAISSPLVIAGASEALLPYHLSSLTQLAGSLALEDLELMEQRVEAIVAGRHLLAGAMAELDVDVTPSSANFILFRPRHHEASAVWAAMVAAGVLVRDCSSWPGLENCLRVTIGTEAENAQFLIALKEALA